MDATQNDINTSSAAWSSENACLTQDYRPLDFSTTRNECQLEHWGMCFVRPKATDGSLFGFTEFVTALALLIVLYTISDIRYRFRIAVAPIPIFKLTYFLIGFIGVGTLFTDLWFKEGWIAPDFLSNQVMWQFTFAFAFLVLIIIWLHYAFVRPPLFSIRNYKKYVQTIYGVILKGSDTELPEIAYEIGRSAFPIIILAKESSRRSLRQNADIEKRKPNVGDYAHDLLLLIGNRKFCRHIVSSAPGTAIEFFEAMTELQKYELPMGQFAQNITAEALNNKDSILYHEDDGYNSGLIGYLKPFSQALYGNYQLVETLGSYFKSPLDVSYKLVNVWDAIQLGVYTRIALIFTESYLNASKPYYGQSYVFYRMLESIKDSCSDVYKLKDIPEFYSSDICKRLGVVVDFIEELIKKLDKYEISPHVRLRGHNEYKTTPNIYDYVAELMFNIIFSASSISEPSDKCWSIQYVTVWSKFFTFSDNGKAQKIIQFKLRRLLYDEVKKLEKFPNYKGSKILGFCLNIMGLKLMKDRGKSYGIKWYALHKAIIVWVENNYLKLVDAQSEVAESCLIGGITFDKESKRLIKTYAKGLNLQPDRDYLELKAKSLVYVDYGC